MISAPGCSLSSGRAVSLTGVNAYFLAQAPAGVSPVTLVPQESRTLHSNQLFIEDFSRQRSCLKVIFDFQDSPFFYLGECRLPFVHMMKR
ncbi:hypothetical protein [Fictibacillus sp. KU28468]|uniref:hypothetical protein n=1 Tax=Fictibacillus sp. KU28468 TaxID=2991053 RepID=UPI00223D99DD|nr:hypothetical protein [Fictibacillus sp. KU28468]UZJ78383.1 hypothetical protein OKX00_20005 [Fictibacillus sp. KU28468]